MFIVHGSIWKGFNSYSGVGFVLLAAPSPAQHLEPVGHSFELLLKTKTNKMPPKPVTFTSNTSLLRGFAPSQEMFPSRLSHA